VFVEIVCMFAMALIVGSRAVPGIWPQESRAEASVVWAPRPRGV